MKSITERITDIKTEIQSIKTTQRTQNDSFQFYRYRTDNLYLDSGSKQYKITFCPFKDTPNKVLCRFEKLNDSSPAAIASYLYVSIPNPLQAEFTVNGMGGYNLPAIQKRAYVTCISNCKGYLRVEDIT